MREAIGRYRVTGLLGEGGMGVVYAAHDDRLDRPVAVKMVRETGDEQARQRFWREARAAAAVNHPHVCQLFEIGDENGELFIAMERLEGESLAARLARGPMPPFEAGPMMLAVLSALGAMHDRGLMHRDLKPSNIFLTPHGVKLLDFGLARSAVANVLQTGDRLTLPGSIVGTPQYMTPEQLTGQPEDARSDIFAVGAVLFESLTGAPPFRGPTLSALVHAVVYEQPPALTGSAATDALDRVIHRALAKKPGDRFQSASDMAQALREALAFADSGEAIRVRRITRLIVLPFRLLRADPDNEFLAFSLPDAVTASLSGLESLVVRTSAVAARFGGEAPNLKAIASEADVDCVLMGTLLRSGTQLRVSTQLVEAPSGTLIGSHTAQASMLDIFQLQDDLTRRIVESLAIPLNARDELALKRDVPANASAYELYLRANELGSRRLDWPVACTLYERCVAQDPQFAPAWARLGKLYRVLAKYNEDDPAPLLAKAEEALGRAMALNPELSIAHKYRVELEVERGRAPETLAALIARARAHPADSELFGALVFACRYCGLLDASITAYERCVRLDPNATTSGAYTFLVAGDYEQARAANRGDWHVEGAALAMLGREPEAAAVLREHDRTDSYKFSTLYTQALLAVCEGRRADCTALGHVLAASTFMDPEGWYLFARVAAHNGDHELAIQMLEFAATRGFYCLQAYVRDPWLDNVRGDARFVSALRRVDVKHREAIAAFDSAGGERLLGRRADGRMTTPAANRPS